MPETGRSSMGYLAVEICLDDNGEEFEVRRETCLCLTAPFKPEADSSAFFTDTVLLNLTESRNGSHISIVWDYVRDEITSVRSGNNQMVLGVSPRLCEPEWRTDLSPRLSSGGTTYSTSCQQASKLSKYQHYTR